MNLKPETLEAIDAELSRFPNKRSAMMNVLHIVQDDLGYLPDEAVQLIAQKLEVQPIHVMECITFYPMYRTEPAGKVHVTICRTLSCALCGSYVLREKLESALGCKIGDVSEDGNFSLDWGECLGSCGTAPVVHVNGALYENVNPQTIDSFIETVKGLVGEAPNLDPTPGTPAYMG